jgi:hypothetical protein
MRPGRGARPGGSSLVRINPTCVVLMRQPNEKGIQTQIGCKLLRRLIKLPGSFHVPSGAIAQLGERIVRNDEVVGSIPTSSTISFNYLAPSFSSQHPRKQWNSERNWNVFWNLTRAHHFQGLGDRSTLTCWDVLRVDVHGVLDAWAIGRNSQALRCLGILFTRAACAFLLCF